MPDIKQVIKALECCVISDNERECPDECPYYERCWGNDDPLEYELKKDILELLKNAGLTALDLVVTQIAKKANDDGRFFSPYEVGLMLIQHGQHDNRFKWGEVIKYSPSEVEKILKEAKQTDAERGEACGWEPMDPDKLMAWMMLPNGVKPQWNPWMPLAPYGQQDKSLKDHDFYLVRVANRGTPMKAMYHIDSPFGFEPCSGDFDPLQVTGWMELPDSTEPEDTVHCRECWKRHLDNCPFYEETDTIARDDYYCQEGERDAEKRSHD